LFLTATSIHPSILPSISAHPGPVSAPLARRHLTIFHSATASVSKCKQTLVDFVLKPRRYLGEAPSCSSHNSPMPAALCIYAYISTYRPPPPALADRVGSSPRQYVRGTALCLRHGTHQHTHQLEVASQSDSHPNPQPQLGRRRQPPAPRLPARQLRSNTSLLAHSLLSTCRL
jgi:hypothetical protein